MASIRKGILGGFKGIVGTVVGATWKGQQIMRSLPPKPGNKNASPKQLAQQLKFATAMAFVQPLSALFQLSFKNFAVNKTGTNSAFSYVITKALKGTYPLCEVDFPSVLMSRGQLPNVNRPVATASAGGDINFAWEDNTGIGSSKANDLAILVVYCPINRSCRYTTGSAMRSELKDTIDASLFTGEVVEVYLGFISDSSRLVATSVYLGQHTVLG